LGHTTWVDEGSKANLKDSYVVCGAGYELARNALRDGLVLDSFSKVPFQNKQLRLEDV